MTVVKLDLIDVFPFFLDNIGVSNYCKGVIATTLFLSSTVPKTIFLLVLVFFAGLALVNRRLLEIFTIKYISGKGVNRFIPSRVLLLFLCKHLTFEIFGVNLSST